MINLNNTTTMIFRRRLVLFSPKAKSKFKLLYSTNDTTAHSYASTSAAAAAAAEVPNDARKVRGRRVPKAQRKVMIEAFVNKYKTMYDGKLPSASDTQKEVGGSYYVVKNILQELKYKSKMSNPIDGNENSLAKKIIEDSECLTEVEEVSTVKLAVDARIQNDSQTEATNYVEIVDVSGKHLEAGKGLQPLSSAEKTFSKEIATPDSSLDFVAAQSNLLKGDVEEIYHSYINKLDNGEEAEENHFDFVRMQSHLIEKKSHPHHEKSKNGKMEEPQAQGDVLEFVESEDDPLVRDPAYEADNKKQNAVSEYLPHKKRKEERYKGTDESDNPAMDISSKQTNDANPPKQISMWGNLKSFANSVLNIWRKM
ncbi:hypothetical protein FNV43_RR21181 [Rhamnella rubrinervis]|uniref:AT3G52170-like helix-turn-helix domain-containing protein n=1 Tax=Rhamnella rubrinervis TaxID=2594499 RepID=A0A8K0E272_9ROSA|nr:hypothetical protein FNV43_RR21181 [Rhamnella rubrinervis]